MEVILIVQYIYNEIPLSYSCGNPFVVSGSNAIRILYVCPFCVDGGIRGDGISLLYTAQDSIDHHLCFPGSAVSTFHQDSLGSHGVERR